MARSAAVLAFAGLLAETSAAVSEPVADELGTLEASLAAHPDDPDLVWA